MSLVPVMPTTWARITACARCLGTCITNRRQVVISQFPPAAYVERMFERLKTHAFAALIATLPTALGAQSLTSLSDIAKVTVLPGWKTANGTRMAALQIDLADGWKTYWRAPGEAGIPPSVDWQGSQNLQAVQFHWPTPDVFTTNGLKSIGYKGVTVVPIEITPSGSGPITLQGRVDIGVCEDICVPISVPVSVELSGDGKENPAILASLADQPTPADQTRISSVSCAVDPIADGLGLTATIGLPNRFDPEMAVIELPDQSVWIATPEISRSGGILTARTELVPPSGQPFLLNRSEIRITLLGDGQAIDIQGCPAG